MSLVPMYVKCRDGSWYREPVLVFAEGFVCFDDEDPPELVLWLRDDGTHPDPMAVLEFVLGENHGVFDLGPPRKSQRVVPGSEPFAFVPAAGFSFMLMRRIPVPTMDEGNERRLSRVGPCVNLDPPPHPNDPHELHIPIPL